MNRLVKQAIADAMPIILAYLSVSATFGVISTGSGIPPSATVLISAWVYAGGAQFMLVSLVVAGSSPISTVITVLLVNLRHFLYGTTLGPAFAPWAEWKKWLYAFGMTDEVFAVSSSRTATANTSPGYQLAFGFSCYASWVVGTIVGAVVGRVVPSSTSSVLAFALPALFLALLSIGRRTIPHIAAAVCGALLATLAAWIHLGNIGIVAGAVVGATLGFLLQNLLAATRGASVPNNGIM